MSKNVNLLHFCLFHEVERRPVKLQDVLLARVETLSPHFTLRAGNNRSINTLFLIQLSCAIQNVLA